MDKKAYEKQLYVNQLKIIKTEKGNQWSLKSIIFGFLFGVGFSFYAPSYHGRYSSKSIQEHLDIAYYPSVIFCFILYLVFYSFVYFGLKNQARIKLKNLNQTKNKLEQIIKDFD